MAQSKMRPVRHVEESGALMTPFTLASQWVSAASASSGVLLKSPVRIHGPPHASTRSAIKPSNLVLPGYKSDSHVYQYTVMLKTEPPGNTPSERTA